MKLKNNKVFIAHSFLSIASFRQIRVYLMMIGYRSRTLAIPETRSTADYSPQTYLKKTCRLGNTVEGYSFRSRMERGRNDRTLEARKGFK